MYEHVTTDKLLGLNVSEIPHGTGLRMLSLEEGEYSRYIWFLNFITLLVQCPYLLVTLNDVWFIVTPPCHFPGELSLVKLTLYYSCQ